VVVSRRRFSESDMLHFRGGWRCQWISENSQCQMRAQHNRSTASAWSTVWTDTSVMDLESGVLMLRDWLLRVGGGGCCTTSTWNWPFISLWLTSGYTGNDFVRLALALSSKSQRATDIKDPCLTPTASTASNTQLSTNHKHRRLRKANSDWAPWVLDRGGEVTRRRESSDNTSHWTETFRRKLWHKRETQLMRHKWCKLTVCMWLPQDCSVHSLKKTNYMLL
jgi:hypothetical protein